MPVDASTDQIKDKQKLSNSQRIKIVVIVIYLTLIAAIVVFILLDKNIYGEVVNTNTDGYSQTNEKDSINAGNSKNQNPQEDEWVEISSIDLPLAESGYYQGGFENARRGVEEINGIGEIDSSRTYRLIADKYVNISKDNGYVDTKYPNVEDNFGYGVCWAVTALGFAQDKANMEFMSKYGVALFEFPQRTGHLNKYDTYALVNNGYGWAIYQSKNLNKDYSFRLSQNAINLLSGLSVKIELTSSQNALIGAHGENVGAKIMIKFDGSRN